MKGYQGGTPLIDPSRFSMVPKPEVPRSTFQTQHAHKTTFDHGKLVPILVDEVIPGDVHKGNVTIFARLATPLFPVMDHITLETFFFFVPYRLVWTNFRKFMGEQTNPGDSISFTIPQHTSPAGGFTVNSLQDYMGLPTVGQVLGGNTISISALPIRAYGLIYNEWFRDENLQNATVVSTGDGPDVNPGNPMLLQRAKRQDYFTTCLPWPEKGGVDQIVPLSGTAPVTGIGVLNGSATAGTGSTVWETNAPNAIAYLGQFTNATLSIKAAAGTTGTTVAANNTPQIFANLSQATAVTINSLRLAFATQKILEKDARGGTRYTELLKNHFGVTPEDARLQRPEYIGGGRSVFNTSAIPQTSATGASGTTTAMGSLAAASVVSDQHSFSYHATEHGVIIGLVNVRADITYQQGIRRMWSRSTRYDFYWPSFAFLGEQAVPNKEIFADGSINDNNTFGYQERWAELRHRPSMITGKFKSTSSPNIDEWHVAEQFGTLPALNATFISAVQPFNRILAAGSAADGQQILFDSVFNITSTRPLPMFSVPGQIDRF